MIKSLTIAAFATVSLAGTAFAGDTHRRAPADAADYYATYDQRAAAPAPAEPAPRADFGSFGANTTARNLGF